MKSLIKAHLSMQTSVLLALGAAIISSDANAADKLVVASNFGHAVVRYSTDGFLPFDHFVGQGITPLNFPGGVRFDGSHRLLVASYGNDRVYVFNAFTGQYLSQFTPTASLDGTFDIAIKGTTVFVSSLVNDNICKFDLATGAFLGTLVDSSPSGPLYGPMGMEIGPDGALWVASYSNNKVLKIDPANGAILMVLPSPPASIPFSKPGGVAFDDEGRLYVSCDGSNNVIRYTSEIAFDTQIVAPNALGIDPRLIRWGPDNKLYIASYNSAVYRWTPDQAGSGLSIPISSGSGGLNVAWGVDFIPDPCASDLDLDGQVGPSDLATLLGDWGVCP